LDFDFSSKSWNSTFFEYFKYFKKKKKKTEINGTLDIQINHITLVASLYTHHFQCHACQAFQSHIISLVFAKDGLIE